MKRQRSSYVVNRTHRPVDKRLINAIHAAANSTQQSTTLFTATSPCTLSGAKVSFAVNSNTTTSANVVGWALVLVRDNISIQTLVLTDGSNFYTPETELLLGGMLPFVSSNEWNQVESNKCKRKLMNGDKLVLITKQSQSGTLNVNYLATLFFKY